MLPYINKRSLFIVLFLAFSFSVSALDLWQYSEAADKDSIFAGVFAASFTFDFNDLPSSEFSTEYPEIYLDYVLPIGLPFSIGASVDSFRTDQYGLGLRPGYHINFSVPNLDVYLMYSVNFDISQTKMVLDHGVRAGVRYVFFNFLCINFETGYRMQNIHLGLSIKLN